jgi:hypothetical protein
MLQTGEYSKEIEKTEKIQETEGTVSILSLLLHLQGKICIMYFFPTLLHPAHRGIKV